MNLGAGLLEAGCRPECWERKGKRTHSFLTSPPALIERNHGSLMLKALKGMRPFLFLAPLSRASWGQLATYLEYACSRCELLVCGFAPPPRHISPNADEWQQLSRALSNPGQAGSCKTFFPAGNFGQRLEYEGWWRLVAESRHAILVGTPQGNFGGPVQHVYEAESSSAATALAAKECWLRLKREPV